MKLPQKMSEALTNTMIEANIIKKEEHDIYSYCYEFLFENIVYIASLILFGALLHNLKETLIFLLIMIPFRTFAGGLHAPASGLCVVLSYLSYFITMLFCNYNIGFSILSHPAFFFLECFTICLMAPIDSSSKKMTDHYRKRNKKICIICCILMILLQFFFYFKGHYKFCNILFFCGLLSVLNVSIAFFIQSIHNTKSS